MVTLFHACTLCDVRGLFTLTEMGLLSTFWFEKWLIQFKSAISTSDFWITAVKLVCQKTLCEITALTTS
jgi:hypothetical protein